MKSNDISLVSNFSKRRTWTKDRILKYQEKVFRKEYGVTYKMLNDPEDKNLDLMLDFIISFKCTVN